MLALILIPLIYILIGCLLVQAMASHSKDVEKKEFDLDDKLLWFTFWPGLFVVVLFIVMFMPNERAKKENIR